MKNNQTKLIIGLALISLAFFSCNPKQEGAVDFQKFYASEMFHDIQMARIFEDSKTFVDCTAKRDIAAIEKDYYAQKEQEGFSIKAFVEANFDMPYTFSEDFASDTSKTMKQHIIDLWPVLTRKAGDVPTRSSLIPLPNDFIVPGGRFREIYYWDSYFTLEGLMISGQEEMAINMTKNFAFLIDSIGFVPNGNRAYYGGRSQPPFFSVMVDRVAKNDRTLFESFLPALQKEYDFWMKGYENLQAGEANNRVVMMEDGSLLNRYWDNYALPRPESYREDYELAERVGGNKETIYRDLRAGAESGWDYSSRWFKDAQTLATIHTTEIIPVDLNTLLYHLELKIAQGYNWTEQLTKAQEYLDKAASRKAAIMKYLWDEQAGFFVDYDFVAKSPTGVLSLAGAFPLFFKIADKAQAKKVAAMLESEFLKPGGFITTNNPTGQQWDAPNAWAPLQWITVNGLYYYDFDELGNEGAVRWLDRNKSVYKSTGKMVEKYNVMDVSLLAGGGEYALQDGFGWTNGVAIAFIKIFEEADQIQEMKRE
uniref:alpha,alpha-trehalase TreF n=2 Tax=Roseivirga sp. TaxID=1964215 RepID=UPI0040475E34